MTSNLSISEALQSDLPEMIALCCAAMEPDIITRFLYSPVQSEAVRKQTESLMASLGKRFTHPTNRCYILKAVDMQTGQIVGWILVKWEEGQPASPLDSSSEQLDFLMHYQQMVRRNWSRFNQNPHVAIGALYVRTDRHGLGIGRFLVEHIYSKYGLDDELVIVQTRAMSEGFYHKLGWVTVDSTDIDLSEWAGKGLGYGLHRSPQMLRYPKSSGLHTANTGT